MYYKGMSICYLIVVFPGYICYVTHRNPRVDVYLRNYSTHVAYRLQLTYMAHGTDMNIVSVCFLISYEVIVSIQSTKTMSWATVNIFNLIDLFRWAMIRIIRLQASGIEGDLLDWFKVILWACLIGLKVALGIVPNE